MSNQPSGLDLEQVFLAIYRLLTGTSGEAGLADLQVLFFDTWVKVAIFSSIVTPILLALLAYVIIRYNQMSAEEGVAFKAKAKPLPGADQAPKNEHWQRVEELAASDSPNDWRVAIMEADVMLENLFTEKGYFGESFGERLKNVGLANFQLVDRVGKAHGIRNQVAHGGSDYILTAREVRHAVDSYRDILNEFDYI